MRGSTTEYSRSTTQVDHQNNGGAEQQEALHHRVVPVVDGLHHASTEPRNAEEGLDKPQCR